MWLATGRRRFEHAVSLGYQSKDDVHRLLDLEIYYELSETTQPKNLIEIMRKFVKEGFLIDNMQGGFDITNLGALLFARDISNFPSISHKSLRVVRYKGSDKRESDFEQEGKRGYAIGFKGVIRFILGRIPKQEVYRDGLRQVDYLFPEVAIREIVANALIHQDFTISGAGPVVEIYDNRLEVINPGGSLIDIDRLLDDRRSRNEKLASTMRELRMCEERGGGLDKAIINIELRKLPAPDFIVSETSFRVIVFGPAKFSEISKLDKRRACFFHSIIKWLQQDYMSNTSLRERFSLPDKDYQLASVVISDTIRAGKIIPADPKQGNRNARYVPHWAASRTSI